MLASRYGPVRGLIRLLRSSLCLDRDAEQLAADGTGVGRKPFAIPEASSRD